MPNNAKGNRLTGFNRESYDRLGQNSDVTGIVSSWPIGALWPSSEIPCRSRSLPDLNAITRQRMCYSALMPASLITFAHLGISDLMTAANSAGELPMTSRPRSANLARSSGSASVLTVSR